ncbi:hypothetical protein QYE76_057378 [Lolium multiflorum]|uniref:non-specific serine/threonine protein kinase n=1 Tax=Lolium multiflorum TaxID=4521 RepID=A0AAD8WNR5_LOLMU|nr:hypothetical protein QYE76_057376 [Lolium multiflorum]KAK1669219.1 hypothetical protein QYE76_057378 [Lolium multiflorum]
MLMKNTGIIPASLNNHSALQEIALTFNQLEGSIPQGLGKITSLKLIELGANHLSRIIPTTFFNLSSLITFGVAQNKLHGTLPYDLGNHLPNLKNLLLDSNSFTGSLPASIVNATEMYELDLGSNNFTGTLPPEIGMLCPGLLVLGTNQLMAATAQDWEFMTFLTNCTDLCILDLRRNMFGGALPSSVANLSTQLQFLWLGYNERLNIAVDIADGLDYLHSNCETPIVHCDLKPSNILLNEDLVAHIGDFGLAKILHESSIEQQIYSRSSTGIRGTIGYVAPEYGQGGQVSSRGDVYSFGNVILELFTGMAPTHEMFGEGLTLQKHVENAFPGMLMQIVDPVLLLTEEANASSVQDESNAMEHGSNAIFSVMQVGLSCSKHAPTERMCMRDAAAAIHGIRDRHVKITRNEEVLITAHNARPFAETSYAAETSRPAP